MSWMLRLISWPPKGREEGRRRKGDLGMVQQRETVPGWMVSSCLWLIAP